MTASIVKLTYAVLLAAVNKGASQIWIGRNAEGTQSVDFEYASVYRGSERQRELPSDESDDVAEIVPAIIRRLAVMANLPYATRDEMAHGTIGIELGGGRLYKFGIEVVGFGDRRIARVWIIEILQN